MGFELLRQILYAFQQCKNLENQLKFDKVTQSLKMGPLLRHSVLYSFIEFLCTIFSFSFSLCILSIYKLINDGVM